jgi:hypothetical protein
MEKGNLIVYECLAKREGRKKKEYVVKMKIVEE